MLVMRKGVDGGDTRGGWVYVRGWPSPDHQRENDSSAARRMSFSVFSSRPFSSCVEVEPDVPSSFSLVLYSRASTFKTAKLKEC